MKIIESATRTEAALLACEMLAGDLRRALSSNTRAGLIVSGGSTPRECLQYLSREDLPWHQVDISLTDERCVPVDHEASNEGMVRRLLCEGPASKASFLNVGKLNPKHLAVSLVGMGEDGHFASIFPDSPVLADLIDVDAPPGYCEANPTSSQYRRITVNLSYLLRSNRVVLLAFGERKRLLLEQPGGLPVEMLIKQDKTPVVAVWAP